MKTMTCRRLGGPCDAKIRGATADEMMLNGEIHIRHMVAQDDEAHIKALQMMEEMQKNPTLANAWYEKFTRDFAAQPEE